MKRILVTGGAGYIGSHTCKQLAQSGFEPVVYDNLERGHPSFVKWGPLVKGDLNNTALLIETLQTYQIQSVLHFAGYAFVKESVEDPSLYYRNNVQGTLSLLQAMQTSRVGEIVFSSSCSVYGNPIHTPIQETHPQFPLNPYGRTKQIIEMILKDYGHAFGLKSISLRYFNAAGADPDEELGENHDPETHLIPLVINSALQRNKKFIVFGQDYPTADGTCIRDYIHVSDLARAHILALDSLKTQPNGKTSAFNLGSGKGFSVKEVIACVEEITQTKIPIIFGERRPGDPALLIADSTLAKETFNWAPQFSSLPQIIESALKYKVKQQS